MSGDESSRASRRQFLKTVGGAVGAAALPLGGGATATATATDPDRFDVAVIGAGFAGVTAARELRHAGLRVVLFEARNRLGGRTFTTRVGERLFELGGTWIHSTQPHVFAEANRYGLELYDTNGGLPERVLWWDGERAREGGVRNIPALLKQAACELGGATPSVPLSALEGLAQLASLMSEFHDGAKVAFPRPFDPFFRDAWKEADTLSVRDRLDEMNLSSSRRGLLEGVLGASAHGDFDQASFASMLRWWALSGCDLERYTDSVARFRFREGTLSLIEAMVEDGRPELRLGTPVRAVVQQGEAVSLYSAAGGRVHAREVIAALPMNVLAKIEFSPALSAEKLAASRARHAGAGVKAYIRLRKAIEPVALFAGEKEPFSSVFTMYAEGPAEGPCDEFVAFGTDPRQIDTHDRAAVQRALRRFLPDVEVSETLAYDWHLDPYALGTWCVLRKGQLTHSLRALRAPQGRVHFAGGDIALGWRGFIDGAIESGNRVAHEVLARFDDRSAGRSDAGGLGTVLSTVPSTVPKYAGSQGSQHEAAFQTCAVCHPTDTSRTNGVGPNLRGVFGRPAAGDPRFAYSSALRARKTRWTERELDAFLSDPAAHVPGTTMPFSGLKDPADRTAVIRLLRQLKQRE